MFENTKLAFVKEQSSEPYLNVPTPQLYNGIASAGIGDKKQMMSYAKSHLIVIGIIRAIAIDIVTRITFRSIAVKKGKGRTPADFHQQREIEAMDLAKKQMLKQKLYAAVFDWLITGEGFIWHGSVNRSKMKEILVKLNITREDLADKGVHVLKHVASTTMSPKYDDKDIKYYEQDVGNSKENLTWTPEHIIHAKFMDLDGRPEGFTPMFSAKPIMETLGLIIDYAGNFFDGGGAPETAFVFPKEHANSDNFKKAKEHVKRFYQTKKRGHLFFAGEMKVEKINDWNKDMEFRQLFVMYVGSLAFMFNMPLHRIQSILGGDMSAGAGASDLSDSGYWRNIYEAQDYWETLLNVGFWNEAFEVDMQFERAYLQDTFRETQATNMALTNIQMLEDLDLIKPEFKRSVYSRLLSVIPNEAINDAPKPRNSVPQQGQMLKNSEILRGQATQRFSAEKASQAGKTSSEQKGM